MRRGVRVALGAGAALLVAVGVVATHVAMAPDDAMAPSLLSGDVVLMVTSPLC